MADGPIYDWFLAVVWADADGVPTAKIFHWDRGAGKVGRQVATAQFEESQSFRSVMERGGYEVVEGQVRDSVTARGVRIALRREFVTVPVPARQRARA
jgi:hypothetical protein